MRIHSTGIILAILGNGDVAKDLKRKLLLELRWISDLLIAFMEDFVVVRHR
jgi:hypothetical protein